MLTKFTSTHLHEISGGCARGVDTFFLRGRVAAWAVTTSQSQALRRGGCSGAALEGGPKEPQAKLPHLDVPRVGAEDDSLGRRAEVEVAEGRRRVSIDNRPAGAFSRRRRRRARGSSDSVSWVCLRAVWR